MKTISKNLLTVNKKFVIIINVKKGNEKMKTFYIKYEYKTSHLIRIEAKTKEEALEEFDNIRLEEETKYSENADKCLADMYDDDFDTEIIDIIEDKKY